MNDKLKNNYQELILHRVHEILLVASEYDAFILEEDESLTEQILHEYVGMNLNYAPRVTRVSTASQAMRSLESRSYDLVIVMIRISDMDPLTLGQKIKENYPKKPLILLAFDESEIKQLPRDISSSIDNVFLWSGNANLFPAIIKHVEDKKNIKRDIQVGDVRVIILVEDNPRYYSTILPMMYKEIVFHAKSLLGSNFGNLDRTFYMRSRPKIMLAKNYEQGIKLFNKYQSNLIGVITDLRFPKKGVVDKMAGLKLAKKIREKEKSIPILIQTTEIIKDKTNDLTEHIIDKKSPFFLKKLRKFMIRNFGFGDFIFRMPDGSELSRAENLVGMIKTLESLPPESLEYHAKNNHFSNWLSARGYIKAANQFRKFSNTKFKNVEGRRKRHIQTLRDIKKQIKTKPFVPFNVKSLHKVDSIMRIGKGSLGGKARGLAFANTSILTEKLRNKFPGINLRMPKTVVIGTDIFDQFMDSNALWDMALSQLENSIIENAFLKARLPRELILKLKDFIEKSEFPLAVRSSSLMEDSQYQPLAGMYATYMLPNSHEKKKERLSQLCEAIKRVFASTYFQDPKTLMDNIVQKHEDEKMAIIIMEMIGKRHDNTFYPSISGVAQSFNYYPVSHMKRNEGVAFIALGLGRTIADGERCLRFSPTHPTILPQFYSIESTIENTQNYFYALELKNGKNPMAGGLTNNLRQFDLSVAEDHGELEWIASTVSLENNIIRDSLSYKGPRVLTFSPLLKWSELPICDILNELLKIGRSALGCAVEIEFALNINENEEDEFCLLQIKPMVIGNLNTKRIKIKPEKQQLVCKSDLVLGDGIINDIKDIIFISPMTFDPSATNEIALEIEKINKKINNPYLLVGPGRWGSADPFLGVPVNWNQISRAKVIVEYSHRQMDPDPSFGSHFFQNITSLHLGYFTLNKKDAMDINWKWLNEQKQIHKTAHLHHVKLDDNLYIDINGRKGTGFISKPIQIEDQMDERESTGI